MKKYLMATLLLHTLCIYTMDNLHTNHREEFEYDAIHYRLEQNTNGVILQQQKTHPLESDYAPKILHENIGCRIQNSPRKYTFTVASRIAVSSDKSKIAMLLSSETRGNRNIGMIEPSLETAQIKGIIIYDLNTNESSQPVSWLAKKIDPLYEEVNAETIGNKIHEIDPDASYKKTEQKIEKKTKSLFKHGYTCFDEIVEPFCMCDKYIKPYTTLHVTNDANRIIVGNKTTLFEINLKKKKVQTIIHQTYPGPKQTRKSVDKPETREEVIAWLANTPKQRTYNPPNCFTSITYNNDTLEVCLKDEPEPVTINLNEFDAFQSDDDGL